MKKFMFSAVALVAFSFAGMANNGGEEKLNIETLNCESVKSEEITLKKDCYEIASDVLDLIDPDMTLTQEQTTTLYNQLVTACLS